MPDAYVPPAPLSALMPVPKEFVQGRASFVVDPRSRIVVGDPESDREAAHDLNDELQARFGLTLPVIAATHASPSHGDIVLGEPRRNPTIRASLAATKLSVPAVAEGYVLRSTPQGVLIAGADRRGTFYGVQTLRQLLRPDAGRAVIPAATIRDWPDHRVRAIHVLLDGAAEEYLIRLIRRVLAPYKFNTLLLEAEHVQWESGRPFWAPDPRGATKAQVRHILEVARQEHVEVIPLIATLGHSEWVFAGLQNEALCREVAYVPRRLRGEGKTQVTCDRGRGVYPDVYDPTRLVTIDGRVTTLNEGLIFPVLQEAVDLFKPRAVHLGHDEVRGPGGVRYDLDLYFTDVLTLDKRLRTAGVRTMLWGDVLWDRREEVRSAPGYRTLPRDITIVPWKYEDTPDYPEVAYFRAAGFPVIGTTWYRLENNFAFSKAAKAAGALGMIRATWTGQFFTAAALTRGYQQLYTYLTAASYFWTVGRPAPAQMPSDAALAQRFADAWKRPAYLRTPVPGTLIDLSSVITQRHIDDDGTGWIGKGSDIDLRALPPGRHRLTGILFQILNPRTHGGKSVVMLRGERDTAAGLPATVLLPWQGTAGCLCFLHTTLDRAPSFGEKVATYTMTLAGGRRVPFEVRYGQHISSWLAEAETGIPSIEQEVAWTGQTRAGNMVALQMARWANPEPGRGVVSIELSSAGGRASPVIFAITGLERCP